MQNTFIASVRLAKGNTMSKSPKHVPIWAQQMAAVNEALAAQQALRVATARGDVAGVQRMKLREADCIRRAGALGIDVPAAKGRRTVTKDVEEIDADEADEAARRIKKKLKDASALAPASVGLSATEYDAMDLRLARIEAQQTLRSQSTTEALARADYQARTEMKLSLKPGAIARHQASTKKAAARSELVSSAFEHIAPSVLRALRMNGLTDAQIASIALAQREE